MYDGMEDEEGKAGRVTGVGMDQAVRSLGAPRALEEVGGGMGLMNCCCCWETRGAGCWEGTCMAEANAAGMPEI